jgi:hypothetical protein
VEFDVKKYFCFLATMLSLFLVQTPKKTVILYEVMRAFRIIPFDGRDHPKDLDPNYMGDSVAHFEVKETRLKPHVPELSGFRLFTQVRERGIHAALFIRHAE